MVSQGLHPLLQVSIGDHPVERYKERRALLGLPGIDGLATREEIRLLLMLSEPCAMPKAIVERRWKKHEGREVSYWHRHPWRFVVFGQHLLTVEPDVYPDNMGMWREVEEVVHGWNVHGFTIKEITGGAIDGLSTSMA